MPPPLAAKIIALAVLLSCCAAAQDKAAVRAALAAACGPANVHFKVKGDKSQHPTPAPDAGKARVYLVGDSTFGVDGQWVGASKAKTYFSISLDPGVHHVCARYSHWLPWNAIIFVWTKLTVYSVHSLDARAGETYYFGPRGYPSNPPSAITRAASLELVQYDADEGARIVAASRFSSSRPK